VRSIGAELSLQTRSFRSSGSNRSRSASELLLRKRPSFLASRRFATGKFGTDAPINHQCAVFKQKFSGVVFSPDAWSLFIQVIGD